MGATSGYVALLSEDGAENEVLFLEAGGFPCDVDPKLPMPIRGLRAEAYLKEHSDANFSHSICPGCAKKYYPDFDLDDKGSG